MKNYAVHGMVLLSDLAYSPSILVVVCVLSPVQRLGGETGVSRVFFCPRMSWKVAESFP
jgi:hypothetical protein